MLYNQVKAFYESLPTTIPFDDFLDGNENGNWGLTEQEYATIESLKQQLMGA